MNSKPWIPWVCFLLALAALGAVYFPAQKQKANVVQLQSEVQGLQTQIAQAEETKKSLEQTQTEELTRLRTENADLLRLRNEIRQLRNDNIKLTKELLTAQSSTALQQQQAQQQVQQLAALNQELRTRTVADQQKAMLNACINNLRQIDGAMQQWALENQKPATAIPTAKDIARYLKDNALPVCPAGGIYTLNAVSVEPTCNIPGHVLAHQ